MNQTELVVRDKEEEESGANSCSCSPISYSLTPSAPDDPRVILAMEEYCAAIRGGDKPDRREFLARHGEISEVLCKCLDGLEFVNGAVPGLSQAGQGPSPVAGENVQTGGPLGDYQIVREVGRGGMGVVYEAVQISLGRRVALKVLPFAAALDTRQLQRFKNEAQAAARLHHTNIVPVHAVGCERGAHFYAMQFIDGQTLAALIADLRRSAGLDAGAGAGKTEEGMARVPAFPGPTQVLRPGDAAPAAGPPPVAAAELPTRPAAAFPTERSIRNQGFFRTAASLGLQAAEALEYAHRQEVIHRDIKPANLLVDDQGNLWITDFGLARLQGAAGLTLTGDLMGTLRYMSPEQALGQHAQIDHRTDIYSLGVTLYEMLTLEPAAPGNDRQEVLRRIERDQPVRPRRLNRGIPAEFQTIVLKAMAKDPAERYTTAQELADDLRRYLEDKPIRARPPTLGQVAAKWARRHRGIVLTSGVAVVTGLVLGIVGLVMSNLRIRAEQARTEAARHRANHHVLLAMKALNQVYLRVARDRFPRDPQREQEDRAFLAPALGFYQELAGANDDDPVVRQAVVEACVRLGAIHEILGHHGPAKQAYEQSQALVAQLVSENPANYSCRAWLATGQQYMGRLLSETGDRPAAARQYRQAQENWARLVADFPGEPEPRQLLAQCEEDLGSLLAQDGAWAAAEDFHRQALALREQLAAQCPADPMYRTNLANSLGNLACIMGETGRHADAESHYRRALDLQARLAADYPNNTFFRRIEAFSARCLAGLLGNRDPESAQTYFRRALAIQGRLVDDFPAVPDFRHELADTQQNLGILLCDAGDRAVGAEHIRKALDLETRLAADFPGVLRYRERLASVQTNWGHLLELKGQRVEAKEYFNHALKLCDQLVAVEPATPEHRQGLALAHFSLGVVEEQGGDWAAAENHYRRGLELQARLVEEVPASSRYRHHLAMVHASLGALLYAKGEAATGTSHLRQSIALWSAPAGEPATQDVDHGLSADALNRLAWLLANCPDPQLRDLDRAVKLARSAVGCAPRQQEFWATLGLAYYRTGDAGAAQEALERADRHGQDRDPGDGFFLAMIYWLQGDQARGRQEYDRAAQSMEVHQPGSEALRRFRAEAAALLGLAKPPDRTPTSP